MSTHETAGSPSARRGGRAARRTDRARGRLPAPAWMAAWPTGARIAFIASVTTLLLFAIAIGADAAVSAGRIHPGVHVGDVAVGGMRTAEAASAIDAYVAGRLAAPVTLKAADATWDVTSESLAVSVDSAALAQGAYEVGRGDLAATVGGRLRALFGGVTVPLLPSCSDDAFRALVQTINETVATPPVDAGVAIEGASVTRIDPVDGVGVDAAAARPEVLAAFLADERVVELGLGPIAPDVSAEGADAAYEAARQMVSGPLTLFYGDRSWEVDPATIGGWIGVRRTEGVEPPVLEAYIASEDVSATVLPMVAEVGKPARDASFEVSNGRVSIVPAEDGLQADCAELSVRLTTMLAAPGERRAELTMQRVEPGITTAAAQSMGIVERISTFTTDFSAGNKPRVNNIHTLADALDGTLIAPGGTFSFNETVGERTAAKGYQEAPAIVNGKLVPQLGGGICQVNTTLFNAVFFSGLPVVERRNHSQYISHYPTGRDATVSWGGPDFKFKNDTPNWVLVATGYTNSTVTISLYGTNPGYEVTYDTGPWTDLKDPPVREVPDPALPAGSRVIDERGVSGRTIVVVRHVKKGGVEIRTDSFKSVYRPSEEVVRVGTKVTSPSTPATGTP